MTERAENHFRLVKAPGHVMHGLALDRPVNRGVIIDGFAQIDVTSVEPDCFLVQVIPMGNIDELIPEQFLEWYTPYNFKGTDYYISAELDMHPLHQYPRARIKVDAPRNIKVMRDELLNLPR